MRRRSRAFFSRTSREDASSGSGNRLRRRSVRTRAGTCRGFPRAEERAVSRRGNHCPREASLDDAVGGSRRRVVALECGIRYVATVAVLATAAALDLAIAGAATPAQQARLTMWTSTAIVAAAVAGVAYVWIGLHMDRSLSPSPPAHARRSATVVMSLAATISVTISGVVQVSGLVDHLRSQVDEPLTALEFVVRIAVTALAAGLVLVILVPCRVRSRRADGARTWAGRDRARRHVHGSP